MHTSWVRTDWILVEHEVVPQLLMHEVYIGRLKRRLEDTESELEGVLFDVSQLIRNLSRRVEHLEGMC